MLHFSSCLPSIHPPPHPPSLPWRRNPFISSALLRPLVVVWAAASTSAAAKLLQVSAFKSCFCSKAKKHYTVLYFFRYVHVCVCFEESSSWVSMWETLVFIWIWKLVSLNNSNMNYETPVSNNISQKPYWLLNASAFKSCFCSISVRLIFMNYETPASNNIRKAILTTEAWRVLRSSFHIILRNHIFLCLKQL